MTTSIINISIPDQWEDLVLEDYNMAKKFKFCHLIEKKLSHYNIIKNLLINKPNNIIVIEIDRSIQPENYRVWGDYYLWCNENNIIFNTYHITNQDYNEHTKMYNETWLLYFKNSEDAMAFKLKFSK